ncbi:MAG: DNA repair ATPase RecN [Saprospiraceae bacterium]|jgi:DNA repair ATPase RecN
MIKQLFKLVIIMVLGILVYNLFLGDSTEKENARKVFSEIKEAGVAVKDLIQSEKKKFDEGKYDEALDKVGNVFSKLKRRAKDIDEKYVDRIAELDETRKDLERRLEELNKKEEKMPESYGSDSKFAITEKKLDKERKDLTKELDSLFVRMSKVVTDMEKEDQ